LKELINNIYDKLKGDGFITIPSLHVYVTIESKEYIFTNEKGLVEYSNTVSPSAECYRIRINDVTHHNCSFDFMYIKGRLLGKGYTFIYSVLNNVPILEIKGKRTS
jgi:hypothetical protein